MGQGHGRGGDTGGGGGKTGYHNTAHIAKQLTQQVHTILRIFRYTKIVHYFAYD